MLHAHANAHKCSPAYTHRFLLCFVFLSIDIHLCSTLHVTVAVSLLLALGHIFVLRFGEVACMSLCGHHTGPSRCHTIHCLISGYRNSFICPPLFSTCRLVCRTWPEVSLCVHAMCGQPCFGLLLIRRLARLMLEPIRLFRTVILNWFLTKGHQFVHKQTNVSKVVFRICMTLIHYDTMAY